MCRGEDTLVVSVVSNKILETAKSWDLWFSVAFKCYFRLLKLFSDAI